jgi:putative copper export protein
MPEALSLIMRWLHISSMATLVGGLIYGRLALTPALESLAQDARAVFGEKAAARFRPLSYAAVAGLTLSGLYNLLSTPGHTARYHMLLGIKLLLVAHVFAVTILIGQPARPRRSRLMAGAFISGLVIIFISAYLRRIF